MKILPPSARLWLAPAMLLLAAGACSRSPQSAGTRPASEAGGGQINVYMWSEYIDPQIPVDFRKATGIDVRIDVYEDTESMEAKIGHGGGSEQYDVLVVSDHAVGRLARLNLIRPLDLSLIPNAGHVSSRFRSPPYDPEGRYSLPYQWGTMGIMYRTDKVPRMEHSWAVLLDPARHPGPVVLIDSMRDMMAAALKYRGNSVNSRNPEELKAAAKAVLAAKRSPHFRGFEGGVGGKNKVVSGDAVAAICYNGDALRGIEEAEGRASFFVPEEGTIIWVDAMVITAGCRNLAAAHAFINYILDPQVGAKLSNFNKYPTPNEAALPLILKEDRENPAIYPPEPIMARMEYLEDLGEYGRLYDELWTAIKSR